MDSISALLGTRDDNSVSEASSLDLDYSAVAAYTVSTIDGA
jgi:hypothetical protein